MKQLLWSASLMVMVISTSAFATLNPASFHIVGKGRNAHLAKADATEQATAYCSKIGGDAKHARPVSEWKINTPYNDAWYSAEADFVCGE